MYEDVLLKGWGTEHPVLGQGTDQVGDNVEVPPLSQLLEHAGHRHVAQTGAEQEFVIT